MDESEKKEKESGLELDLTPFMSQHSHPEIERISRVLKSPNTFRKASPVNGFFCRSSSDIDFGLRMSLEAERSIDALPARYDGLKQLEKDQQDKHSFANGHRPFSYFKDGTYPFNASDTEEKISPSVVDALLPYLRMAASKAGVPTEELKHYGPSASLSMGKDVLYKLHSNYGIIRSVAGRDKRNPLSLFFHTLAADRFLRLMIMDKGKRDIPEIARETFGDIGNNSISFQHPHAAMLLKRSKIVNITKPRPEWRAIKSGNSLKLISGPLTAGLEGDLRSIKALPAWFNILINLMARIFSMTISQIPGGHVGHILMNTGVIVEASDSWGKDNVQLIPEDVTAFDDTTSLGLIGSFEILVQKLFSLNECDMAILREINTIPLASCGFPGEERNGYTLLHRKGGVPSGSQDTTMRGTLINLMAIIEMVRRAKNMPAVDVLKYCINFSSFSNTPKKKCFWGFIIKGDDLVFIIRKGYLREQDVIEGRRSLGWETRIEPAPIFLQNYIDQYTIVENSTYFGVPQGLKKGRSCKSTGLLQRRIKNRFEPAEHPPEHKVPARYGMLSNILDLQWHPTGYKATSIMLRILNRHDDDDGHEWTRDSLLKYCTSQRGKDEMEDYASTVGVNDAFMRDIVNRTFQEAVDVDDDQLPSEYGPAIESIKEIISDSLMRNLDITLPDAVEKVLAIDSSAMVLRMSRKKYNSEKSYIADSKSMKATTSAMNNISDLLR